MKSKYIKNLRDLYKKIYFFLYIILGKIFKKLDPLIKMRVGKKYLFINLSHKLPVFYYNFPNYDRALPRICKKVKELDEHLTVIDIGANIGDTVSLITDESSGSFLCVEGDSKYLHILKKNIKLMSPDSFIEVEDGYCGNEDYGNVLIDRKDGTAKIIKINEHIKSSGSQGGVEVRTLDNIIQNHPVFKNTNLLKIDTDGFEVDVLSGGKVFLKNKRPLIYFEFTPDAYSANGHCPEVIWQILEECNYNFLLFYDNFGRAIDIVNIAERNKIKEMIEKIDKKTIYYYDVLACNQVDRYLEILKAELNLFKI